MEKENTLKLWISPQKQNNILQKQKIVLEKSYTLANLYLYSDLATLYSDKGTL